MQSVGSPTSLDIIKVLWEAHGPLALGWIVAFFEAWYIILLHHRAGAIYREYVEFAKQTNKDILPVMEKSTEVMTRVLQVTDETADKLDITKTRQDQFIGQLDILIRSFIDTHTYKIGQPLPPTGGSNSTPSSEG